MEVDLIIGNDCAVEIKATNKVSEAALKGLKAFRQEGKVKRYLLVSNDPIERQIDGIQLVHWKTYINSMKKQYLGQTRGR